MNPTIEQLHEKLSNFASQVQAIENKADTAKRALTDEEKSSIASIHAQFKSTEEEIELRQASASMQASLREPLKRVTQPADVNAAAEGDEPRARITGGLPTGTTKGSFGFRNFGEWAKAAHDMKVSNRVDQRIMNAPSTFGAEGTNADGGFAVPPDFRANLMKLVQSEESLLSRTDQQITSANGISLPQDATTPWQTSGGVQGGWAAEGGTFAASKPALGLLTVKANKVGALVPLTDELLEDVPAMNSYLSNKVPEKFNSMINSAIVAGTGAGQPQGLLNAACKITVAAVSGQGAGTIVAKNILGMWARMYAPLRKDAVWLINQDCEQQLQQLVMPGTNPSAPAYMPPGGLSASPYATLMGRPIICVEACSALGTEGDIILTNLSQYLTVMKAGGMRSDVSMHLYFDSDHTAFRFVMRVGGQSYWPAAVARQNGSNTLSPIVTLNSTRT